jgi:hypothetical protein
MGNAMASTPMGKSSRALMPDESTAGSASGTASTTAGAVDVHVDVRDHTRSRVEKEYAMLVTQ